MNPADIYKASLSTAGNALAPGLGSLFSLGSSLFGTSQSTPKQTYASSLQSSVTPPVASSIPSGPQSKLPTAAAGGNSSATTPVTTPKAAYINSQTGSTGTTAPSTAPVTPTTAVNPNAAYQGNTISPPVDTSSPQYQYKQAFDAYLQSLSPTDAETSASKALAAQQLQSQKDQETALDKPGQTLGFATGEAARVNKNNAFQTDALANTVNALTGARTASTAATKAKLDFEQGLYNDANAAAKPDYSNVSPGATVFDNKTGKAIYTAPTTASQNPGGGPAGSTYVAGTDPVADGWITAINNKQATIAQVPAAYKNIVAQGLGATTQDDPLKTNALTAAQQLLSQFDNSSGFLGYGGSKQAVGKSSLLPVIPGTQEADFLANLDQLKSLLSLDNVKYLKGQGAVSDAERKLLADSATQLSQSQSEGQFRTTLQNVISGLQKFGALNGSANTSTSDVNADPDYQSYLAAIGQ